MPQKKFLTFDTWSRETGLGGNISPEKREKMNLILKSLQNRERARAAFLFLQKFLKHGLVILIFFSLNEEIRAIR
jgi:hypothetical protein